MLGPSNQGDCQPNGPATAPAGAARTDSGTHPLRRRLYEVLEAGQGIDRASRAFDAFIVILILLNVAAFVAETVPWIAQEYSRWFRAFEFLSVAVFTVEYVLRLWVAVEVPFLSRLPAWKARLTFAARGPQIIDLLAILPFYLGELLAIDLRVLRVLRLLRFLKLSRYSPAMHALTRVLYAERRTLAGAFVLLCAAVLFASTGIYYLESQTQPDRFGSVPDAAWWAIATLTTVGYGDVTPVTPLGKVFGSVVMVIGLCILALPVAIISTGFAQEAARRDFVVTWSLVSRVPLLAQLDARDVARIMPLLHAHNLPPNVEVVAAGSPGEAMYFIAAGKVLARGSRNEDSYGTGDFFGDVAMIQNDLHRFSYVTCAKCRLLKLHKEDFAQLEAASPTIASRIRAVAAERGGHPR